SGAMAAYTFDTITEAEALAYDAFADQLHFGPGVRAHQVWVGYLPASGGGPEQVTLTYGRRTVTFGAGLYGEADFVFGDGSRLFVGTPGGDLEAARLATGDGLFGGPGADTLRGGDGNDLIHGNIGDDV